MLQTLVNIDSGAIISASESAKPISLAGKAAVENLRAWLSGNAFNASTFAVTKQGLEDLRDPGLESLNACFAAMLEPEQLKVAVAYEELSLANKSAGIFAVSQEAFDGLAGLYRLTGAKIIQEIAGGALDSFKVSPVIAKLINWAVSASKISDTPEARSVASSTYEYSAKTSLVPVVMVAELPNKLALLSIAGLPVIASANGSMQVASNEVLADMPQFAADILSAIKLFRIDANEPALLTLNDEVLERIKGTLAIAKLSIDMQSGEIVVDGKRMHIDKFSMLVENQKDQLTAALVGGREGYKASMQVLRTLRVMQSAANNAMVSYAFYAAYENQAVIAHKWQSKFNLLSFVNGQVTSIKSYATAFAMLASDALLNSPALYEALQTAYADELSKDLQKVTVRQQIAEQLTAERVKYTELLAKIDGEIATVKGTFEPNGDKEQALTALRDKVTGQIATVDAELAKLARK